MCNSFINYLNDILKSKQTFNSDIYQNIDKEFKNKYQYNVELPHKLSVSQIKQRYYEKEENNNIYNKLKINNTKFDKEKDIDSIKIGIIYHKIFEKINFSKIYAKEEIENEIQSLVKNDIIDIEEYKYIDINSIYNFVNSDIYKRISISSRIRKNNLFGNQK